MKYSQIIFNRLEPIRFKSGGKTEHTFLFKINVFLTYLVGIWAQKHERGMTGTNEAKFIFGIYLDKSVTRILYHNILRFDRRTFYFQYCVTLRTFEEVIHFYTNEFKLFWISDMYVK